jgi:hypothetical protein
MPPYSVVARDLFDRPHFVAGNGAIDGADDGQVLQRIDHIQQVSEETFVVLLDTTVAPTWTPKK